MVGASPAAITAAVQAARMGQDVALFAPRADLGGILANGLRSNDLDNGRRAAARLFVGGTVEGDLMAVADVSHTWG